MASTHTSVASVIFGREGGKGEGEHLTLGNASHVQHPVAKEPSLPLLIRPHGQPHDLNAHLRPHPPPSPIPQTNYAVAVIIIKDKYGPLETLRLPPGKTDRVIIPVYQIGREDGQILTKAIGEEEVICAFVGGVRDMWSFGNGTFGQLGLSQHLSFQSVERPTMAVQEKGIKKVTARGSAPPRPPMTPLASHGQVACGANHTLALLDSGQLFSWGHNEHGQLGNGSTSALTNPTFIESLGDWKAIELPSSREPCPSSPPRLTRMPRRCSSPRSRVARITT